MLQTASKTPVEARPTGGVSKPGPTPTTRTTRKRRGRPPGFPKSGGRKAGTPNKKTAQVHEILLSLKCDPITGMARLAMNKKNPPDLRGKMFAELAGFLYPKRKATEVSGPNDTPLPPAFSSSLGEDQELARWVAFMLTRATKDTAADASPGDGVPLDARPAGAGAPYTPAGVDAADGGNNMLPPPAETAPAPEPPLEPVEGEMIDLLDGRIFARFVEATEKGDHWVVVRLEAGDSLNLLRHFQGAKALDSARAWVARKSEEGRLP